MQPLSLTASSTQVALPKIVWISKSTAICTCWILSSVLCGYLLGSGDVALWVLRAPTTRGAVVQEMRPATISFGAPLRAADGPLSQAPRRQIATALHSVQIKKDAPAVATQDFDLMAYIQEKAAAVNAALDKYVPDGLPPHPKTIYDAMRHSLLAGGKRIRPALAIAACEMVGGTEEMAMPTACALEMIHTMSLIHDDLPMMDNDDFRRGKPTCHKVYGEAVALLAGDALLSQSFGLIAKETRGVPADRVLKSIGNLATLVGAEGLVGGQVMDIQYEGKGNSATLDVVEYIHTHKTAALLEAAVYNGACIGGASDRELEVLRRFAQKIGLAFQIIDDILDSTMSAEQLGKTAGKDDRVEKATYVRVVGLEESRAMANRLIEEAKADLQPWGSKAVPLLALAEFITSRSH
jgi:geranylgeranyl diphosphate synthase type II